MASNLHKKYESSASTCTTEGSSASSSPPSPVNPHHGQQQPTNNAPKYGTLVPNRVFVGGISGNTTESELAHLFSAFGNVKATKVISDRAGVSKGYGFVTFETEEEAKRLMQESDSIVLKERKLNIAPAIKKQPFSRSYEVASPPAVAGNTIFYQNGMPYTFHNGVAYFTSTAPPHSAATSPLATGADPNAVYQTAYVSPTATAHSPATGYPVIYPCTAQPVFMSQQFQYQPMPPPTQNSQYVYTTASSPSSGTSGGGAPPPGTPLPTLPPQHYYSPSPLNPGELYYNMTPVSAGQAFGPLMTADGILYETPPGTESSNNPSAEKRPYNNRSSSGGYYREGCPRFGAQNNSRYIGAGNNGGAPRGAPPGSMPGGRYNSAPGKRNGPPISRHLSPPSNRSPPPAPYSPLTRLPPDSCLHYGSVSPQFHPGARQTYYQPPHQNNIAGGNGSAGQRRYLGGGTRKSSSMNGNRSNGSGTNNGKYSRMGMNGVQALVPPKMMVDKGGAGDASSLLPMTPPGTPHGNTGNLDGGLQDVCHEMQALVL